MRFGIFIVMAGREAGGVETYEHNLVRSLAALDQHNEYHVFCLTRAAVASFQLVQKNFTYHVLWPNLRWLSIPMSLPLQLLRSKVDLFHATFLSPPFAPKDYVLTVHDACIYVHPELYPPGIRWRMDKLIGKRTNKARVILCDSEHTRDLIAERFGLPMERLTVVYPGVSDDLHPVAPDSSHRVIKSTYKIDSPYILFVGHLRVCSKNILRLLEAFQQFQREVTPDVKLVLVGRRAWTSGSLDQALERLQLQDHVIELGHVRDQHLPILYSGAEMLVFPSLCEGFGFPVVEAMACGCPVITSNISCLPEVAGGAAMLVDPYSVQDIAGAMQTLTSDSALRASLRAKGLERAKFFAWERTAQQTLSAYERALTL